ncbi:MAG TPA: N-acetylglucosamine-specific PTS transporter subunit IIBC [Steroidobacteraceae bacterium]|nr:N-acetylglucosamine-specific PTS transporter subunit IIBC [Steroidobacteraceae bacterium]
MKGLLAGLQQLGRAMMLPIAVLPIAALLLRLGQPDLLNVAAIATAGDAIFSNLGLLFAIGIAVGLARENHGAAGLAGVVCFLVMTKGAEILLLVPPDVAANLPDAAKALAEKAFRAKEISKLSVPAGILSGLISGLLYNRYSDMRLPAYLAFFGGRRFVPIVSGLAGLVLAFAFGYGFPALEHGMDSLSRAVLGSESIGLFAYGVLNRALIVTGLHHIINNLAWFLIGDYHGATGDLNRFFAGDPSAGAFMTGFFPVMMFGLPAACLAMYRAARPERRAAVGGMLMSMALTSFLTGVTEPIEFAFMFLAPLLYALHALMTGLSMALTHWLGMHLGFGFSAGLFDYVLNFSRSTRPWLLLPVGLAYFALYYVVFRWAIVKFDLKTPGREPDEAAAAAPADAGADAAGASGWVHALGGAANLLKVDACTTRLRLQVADNLAIDEAALKRLGSRGVVRPGAGSLQVVVGPVADQLAGDIRKAMRDGGAAIEPARRGAPAKADVAALTRALGGAGNLAGVEVFSTRLKLTLKDAAAVDEAALRAAGFRGAVRITDAVWHVIVGPEAERTALALRAG